MIEVALRSWMLGVMKVLQNISHVVHVLVNFCVINARVNFQQRKHNVSEVFSVWNLMSSQWVVQKHRGIFCERSKIRSCTSTYNLWFDMQHFWYIHVCCSLKLPRLDTGRQECVKLIYYFSTLVGLELFDIRMEIHLKKSFFVLENCCNCSVQNSIHWWYFI
jgi:hypothetical protein